MSDCICECVQLSNFGQCEEFLRFDLGALNYDSELVFNITGRSFRIYRVSILTDENGIAIVPTSSLPSAYLSTHSKSKYKVWFENSLGEKVSIKDTKKDCFEFSVSSIIDLGAIEPEVIV